MGNYQITVARSCDWETVYAAKLTCFPFERRDYKPFAQGRLCLCPEGLHVQLISFEVKPLAAGSVPESSCLPLCCASRRTALGGPWPGWGMRLWKRRR